MEMIYSFFLFCFKWWFLLQLRFWCRKMLRKARSRRRRWGVERRYNRRWQQRWRWMVKSGFCGGQNQKSLEMHDGPLTAKKQAKQTGKKIKMEAWWDLKIWEGLKGKLGTKGVLVGFRGTGGSVWVVKWMMMWCDR